MSRNVFANGMEIAAKAGDGKVISAFPDVCMSPPAPPAGPIPVPYPCTSFSKDAASGSSSVKIGGKPVMLRDQSYYKTSPLGDEAATRSFGGSVVTHTITGKTYFGAWSMDVLFEGKNVVRHLDLTTSNHASYPGSTPPLPNAEAMVTTALARISAKLCPCCGSADCPAAFQEGEQPQSFEDFYQVKTTKGREQELRILMGAKANACTCNGKVFPQAPCDVFRPNNGQSESIKEPFDAEGFKADYRERVGARKNTQINHVTPTSASGCPTADGNLQAHALLCPVCKAIDDAFTSWQGNGGDAWKDALKSALNTSIRKFKHYRPAHW